MLNLTKNTLRSFKKNAAAIFGLTFLTFVSCASFTVLNTTSHNISSTYNSLKNDSNLHDFIVNEQYNTGDFSYKLQSSYEGTSSDNKSIPWPSQTGSGSTYTRVYGYELDVQSLDPNSIIYLFWNKNKDNSIYDYLLKPTITITSSTVFTYETNQSNHTSTETYNQCSAEFSIDANEINTQLHAKNEELAQTATTTNTPILTYLQNNGAQAREFKSFNINNSPDNIYYKIIDSNIDNTIDKLHIFDGRNNFTSSNKPLNISDFNPIPKEKIKYINDQDQSDDNFLTTNSIINYGVEWLKDSSNRFNSLSKNKLDALGAFWAILANGVANDSDFNNVINENNQYDWQNLSNDNQISINNSLSGYSGFDKLISGYKWTITATKSQVPISWYIQDWTAAFTVVNPQYLNANNLSPINVVDLGANNWDDFKDLMNNTKQDARDQMIGQYAKTNPKSAINIATGLPTIIIGSGVSIDFVYPIVDFAHLSPNFARECLVFGNDQLYDRVIDGYRSNTIESFVVAKFPNGVDHKQFLDKVNQEASNVCNFPAGVKCAYLATDISDILNPSALRIQYIPKLIDGIKAITWLFTIFILLISLFICAIIVFSYIGSLRNPIGIMRANGVRKRNIIGSLLPFAIIPGVVASIGGYFLGWILQKPTLGLFSNYWTLPTQFSLINLWMLLGMVLIFSLVYIAIICIATVSVLRTDANKLIRVGAEYKVNIVAQKIKKPLKKTSILSRFRISLAFNSMSKLVVLSLMTIVSCCSLMVGFGLINKFDSAKNKTFDSRQYSFAINLQTPTNAGGQYYPVDAASVGCSGFIDSDKDNGKKVWIPNSHYAGDNFYGLGDTSMQTITGNASASSTNYWCDEYGIGRKYYQMAYSLTDFVYTLTDGKVEKAFFEYNNGNDFDKNTNLGKIHGNMIYPTIGDSTGQNNDINYLKNMSLCKFGSNFTVGAASSTSNPWTYTGSLIPENQKNIIDNRFNSLTQTLGQIEGVDINNQVWTGNPHCLTSIKDTHNDFEKRNLFFNFAAGESFFTPERDNNKYPGTEEKDTSGNYINPPHYSFNQKAATPIVSLSIRPRFAALLNAFYSEFPLNNKKFRENNINYDTAINDECIVAYNQVPLKLNDPILANNDETYTHIDATHNNDDINIVGIKDDTKYVTLKNKNTDLLNKISINNIKKGYYPIIVNQYAAHKYDLSVGKIFTVDITNQTNRYNKIIGNNVDVNGCPNAQQTFNVVGVCDTYQNSDFFINQQLANWLLGMRSKLTDANPTDFPSNTNFHNYYNNSYLLPSEDYMVREKPYASFLGTYYSEYDESNKNYIVDLNQPSNFIIDGIKNPVSPIYDKTNGQTSPYGFNGVFTKNTNGSNVINSVIPLYSPSGIYPGSDRFSSVQTQKVLGIGTNLQYANYVSGIRDSTISDAFNIWRNQTDDGQAKDAFDSYLGDSNANITSLYNKLTTIYGTSCVVALVASANDKNSSNTIFNHLADTTNKIENVVAIVFCLMFLIIVLLMSYLVITNSKRLASMLKALGYNDKENALSFMSLYLPTLVIAFGFAIPLSYGVMYAIREFFFRSAQLLISASMPWFSFVGATLITGAMMGLCVLYAYRSLAKVNVAAAIKE